MMSQRERSLRVLRKQGSRKAPKWGPLKKGRCRPLQRWRGSSGKGEEVGEAEGSSEKCTAPKEGQGQLATGCEGSKAGAASAAAGMEMPVLIAQGGFGKVYRYGRHGREDDEGV